MHSEWIDGVILRPMMDAGYTAWREGDRLGVGYLVGDTIEVESGDARVRGRPTKRAASEPAPEQTTTSSSSTRAA